MINVLLLLLLLLLAGVRSGRGWPTPVLCDPSTHVACRNRPDICIPFERLQDGQADCPDASDEGQLFFFFLYFFLYSPQWSNYNSIIISSIQNRVRCLVPPLCESRELDYLFEEEEEDDHFHHLVRTPAFCSRSRFLFFLTLRRRLPSPPFTRLIQTLSARFLSF